jgi:hypothetical protein
MQYSLRHEVPRGQGGAAGLRGGARWRGWLSAAGWDDDGGMESVMCCLWGGGGRSGVALWCRG